ncbi:MAG: Mrp/NBP35 family ATP-binding protein, partial [Pseudomonadales bacterium]|nr:Mrp/NBP35 family ATP-binding protein [Pseudomonadales bacterium]
GKSATAANLALALQAEGAAVGLLDADIYGPSQPAMLGIDAKTRPEISEQKTFIPVPAYGLQTMSMGYMVTEKTPMVWRGPMVSGALMQMLKQTAWGELDYLLIDMPPGTGDIQLTLAQQVPCSGAVIVTTPQNIATLDARKGIEMFHKVGIPCMGVVENMALHICSKCGHSEAIFGSGGGESIASEYAVPLLGSLPLDPLIREGLDRGQPIVACSPGSAIATQYVSIARQLAVQVNLAANSSTQSAAPEIIISED